MKSAAQTSPEPISTAPSLEPAVASRWLACARVFFLRHVPGPDGHDLAHEAVTVVLEAVRSGQLKDQALAGPYLLGVCRNLVSRRARTQARRDRAQARLVDVDHYEMPVPVDPFRLWSCFNQLNARSREILERCFVSDEEAAQIAASLRMTEGNVRVVKHRALSTLRTCLEVSTKEPR